MVPDLAEALKAVLCPIYKKPFDILAKGSNRLLWRPRPHPPQTSVSFEFDVQLYYAKINGSRWKVIY